MTEKAAHTPGPWRINRSGETEQYPALVVSDGKPTGYVCSIPPKHESAEANARLIAAAPKMLDTLKKLLAAEDFAASQGVTIDDHVRQHERRDLIASAIDEATD